MSEWHTHITCPVCGFVDEETVDYPDFKYDGDIRWWWCARCENDIEMICSISWEFKAVESP